MRRREKEKKRKRVGVEDVDKLGEGDNGDGEEKETRREKHGQDKFQTLLLPESGNSSRDIDGKTNKMERNLGGQPQRTENVGISR